jgi:two-component system, OmpR family, phosphate regulon response regulator PhoB
MPRLLLIDDEQDLQEVLTYHLAQAGYHVRTALTGESGLRMAKEEPTDLVLLDVMLPDILGTEVCKRLRSDPRTSALPVLMLTAKGEEGDRVAGFELGADDYVVKPFSVKELLLRVQVILRRRKLDEDSSGVVEFGMLRIDREAHRTWVDGAEVALTALELKLLCTLYDRKSRVQKREVLLDDVWGTESEIGPRTVDTSVRRLREKLGAASRYIQTVHGAGYRFAPSPDEAEL